jgi:uncharacterized SAM-binding protein YcdF (DUF218 family)
VLRRLVLAAALVVAGLAAAGAVLFAWAPFATRNPRRADAIVVLAGSRTRLAVALRLFRRGVAPTLVVSRDPGEKRRRRLCRRPPHGVVCFLAVPYSTRGEARAIARLARTRGWHTVVVVSSRFHLFRVRLLVRRCTSVRLQLVPAPVTWWTWPIAIFSEWAKLAVAETLRRSC